MVRVKHRYLLGQILFPTAISADDTNNNNNRNKKTEGAATALPYVVSAHRPVPVGFTAQDLRRLITSSVLENFGEYGGGAATPALSVKYFSPATSTFIIRTHRDHYRLVWAAMTLITNLQQYQSSKSGLGRSSNSGSGNSNGNLSCVFQVVRVSGTIVKAEEEAIRRAREMVRRAQSDGVGAREGVLAAFSAGDGDVGEKSDVSVEDEEDSDVQMDD